MYEATADRDHLVELIRKYSGVFQDEAEAARLEDAGDRCPDRADHDGRRRPGVRGREAGRDEGAREPDRRTSWFLTMPDDVFLASFGYEWYIRADGRSDHDTWLFPP
jgi:hypothetical protein